MVKRYSKTGAFLGKKDQSILSGISFLIKPGECLGLVGESGAGKSTLGRLILGLEKPCKGEILIENQPVHQWGKKYPGRMSVVFQDYTTSINPGFNIEKALEEPMMAAKKHIQPDPGLPLGTVMDAGIPTYRYVLDLLKQIKLSKAVLGRYPHELSGGQLQRVCIARANATHLKFILFDEALSSLDAPVQAQIIQLRPP